MVNPGESESAPSTEADPSGGRHADRTAEGFHPALRRGGLITFATGFALVFSAAAAFAAFQGASWAESFAAGLQRLGMLLILLGGIAVLAAYQLVETDFRSWPTKLTTARSWRFFRVPYMRLVAANLVGVPTLCMLVYVATAALPATAGMVLVRSVATVAAGLAALLAFTSRGMLRGYGFGVLAGLLLRGPSWSLSMSTMLTLGSQLAGSPQLGRLLIGDLAGVALSGLICAAVAIRLEPRDGLGSPGRLPRPRIPDRAPPKSSSSS